jgi:cell filamentation protein
MNKVSIRFFNDREIRAVWDDANNKWWFSVIDIVSAITDSPRPRVYWGTLKNRLKTQGGELYSKCIQLKLMSTDGKKYATDCFSQDDVIELVKVIPSKNSIKFLDWFIYSDNSIDGQSKKKAYTFWGSNLIAAQDIGTTKALQQIHAYIFGGLYDFAGQIRQKNISKGGFQFAVTQFLDSTLRQIEQMLENTFEEIVDKYVEMNIAHPFMESNGRSTRIWLDLRLKKRLKKCVDWSKISKNDYLNSINKSAQNSTEIKNLLKNVLTDEINSREMFMKGIDYSYYYEEEEF